MFEKNCLEKKHNEPLLLLIFFMQKLKGEKLITVRPKT